MDKQLYRKLLRHPKWISKRKEILERDGHMCTRCRYDRTLQVHHLWYIQGQMPWEAENEHLVTLCGRCHQEEHEKRPIQAFIKIDHLQTSLIKPKIIKVVKTKKKKKLGKRKSRVKLPVLKGRDKRLQARYDKLKDK